jgi:hypothetical protein
LIDLAINNGIPIIPVRFAGGLATEAAEERLEFPVGLGGQDYYLGTAIDPSELDGLPYVERSRRVLSAINNLGPFGEADLPLPADEDFAQLAAVEAAGRTAVQGIMRAAIQAMPELGDRMQQLLTADAADKNPAALSPAEIIAANLLGR